MKRIVIDIETLGRKDDAVILSFGCFEIDGKGQQMYASYPSIGQQLSRGRAIEYETVKWWAKQTHPATGVFNIPEDDRSLLSDFCGQIQRHTNGATEIWANSPSFDLAILRHLFQSVGFSEPWPFWVERDVRTLKNVPHFRPIYEQLKADRKNPEHVAMFDAEFEASIIAAFDEWALGRRIDNLIS